MCAWGYAPDYGPFEEEEKPRLFPLYACEILKVEESDTEAAFPTKTYGKRDRKSMARIRIAHCDEPWGIFLSMVTCQGEMIAGPHQITGRKPVDIYWADLNRDGKEDFIVPVWLRGCGLASGYFNVTFKPNHKATTQLSAEQKD